MLPRRLQLALLTAEAVGFLTLLRSVAYDRWITVLASVLLLAGAAAAHRGRAWGPALAFGAAVAFPVAFLVGIAPPWFCLVGAVGAWPYLLLARSFARFDRAATLILTAIMAAAGTAGAVLWREYAWSVFSSVPALFPSIHANHGLALLLLSVAGVVVARRRLQALPAESTSQLRVAASVRIAEGAAETRPGTWEEGDAWEEVARPEARRMRSR